MWWLELVMQHLAKPCSRLVARLTLMKKTRPSRYATLLVFGITQALKIFKDFLFRPDCGWFKWFSACV